MPGATVEMQTHHVDQGEFVLVNGIHVGRVVALCQNATMHSWVEGLHPTCTRRYRC